MKYKNNIISFILAIINLRLLKSLSYDFTGIINNFILLILYLFNLYSIKKLNKKRCIYSAPFALIYSGLYIVGNYFDRTRHLIPINLSCIGKVVLLGLLILFILVDIIDLLEKKDLKNDFLKTNKYTYLILTFIFIICMTPTFLALYPGVVTGDPSAQIGFGLNNNMSEHHPILHTLIIYGFYSFGKSIGNVNLGVALMSITQIISLAIAFSYSIYIMNKNNINKYYILFTIILYAISPLNGIMGAFITKDIYFTALFLIFFSKIIDHFFNNKEYTKKDYIFIAITAILMSLFRKQGVYVLIFFLIFNFIFTKSKKENITLIISIILFLILSTTLSKLTDARKASMVETLSLPVQQISTVVVNNKDSISKKDLKDIYKLIPEKTFDNFMPYISDPIKSKIDEKYLKKNIGKYLGIWLKLGLKNKTLYIEQALYQTYGYWYIDIRMPHWGTYLPYNDNPKYTSKVLGIKEDSKLESHREEALDNLLHAKFQDDLITGTFSSTAICFVILLLVLLLTLYYKKYSFISVLSIVVGLWGTLILGPTVSIRYAYPLIVISPILLSTIFKLKTDTK